VFNASKREMEREFNSVTASPSQAYLQHQIQPKETNMLKRVTFSALFVLVIGAALAAADQPYEEPFEGTYPVTSNATVSLENMNGDVSIDVWNRDEVQVKAVKRASSPELLAKLDIKVKATDDSVRIETDYKRSHDHGSRSVEYTLMVPRVARVDSVELVNGNLLIIGVEGGVQIESVNGRVKAQDLAGPISIESVNGGIECATDYLQAGDSVSLESVNGTIDLRLAGGANIELAAETVNGRITEDLGIEVRQGQYVGSTMRGTVGGGGTIVSLETVNGAIAVHGG